MLSNHFKKIQYKSSKGTIFKCNYSTYHTFRSANSLYWQLINTSSSIYTEWPNVKRICSFKKSKNEKKSYEKKSKMPCHSLKFWQILTSFSFSWHRRPLLRQTLDIVLSASSVIFLSFNARPTFETFITVGEICIWRCMHIKIMFTIMYAC